MSAVSFFLIVLMLVGCPQGTATEITETPKNRARNVSLRIWEKLDKDISWTPRCEVDDVLRPALGCNLGKEIFRGRLTIDDQRKAYLDIERPIWLEDQAALIKSVRNPRNILDDGGLPPLLLPAGRGRLQGELENAGQPDEEIRIKVIALELASIRRSWRSRTQAIAKENELVVHLAVDPRAVAIGAGSTRFKITIDIGGEEHLLLEEILQPESRGWQERTISLNRFAGQQGVFQFAAEPAAGVGATLIAPLFGSPVLTAPVADRKPPSVILISIDTLRGDFVGQIRDGRSLTESIDEFGRQGVVFSQAMTTYPSTTASHMSILTGLYPSIHNVIIPGTRVSRKTPIAAEIFSQAGYFTGAVTENAMIARSSGFARGFDFYREEHGTSHQHRLGFIEDTLATATEWIRAHHADPYFFFIHSYQVHSPYFPPPEYDVFTGAPDWLPEPLPAPKLRMLNAYSGEVLYTDAMVGRFLAELEEIGIGDDTVVIITSDHGEEFGVHRTVGHSGLLPESVMHVPLIIRAPNQIPPNRRVDSVVSLVDILPTILELTGQPPLAQSSGTSLMARLNDPALASPRAVYGENRRKTADHISARTDTHRFIRYRRGSRPTAVFATKEDPLEMQELEDPALRSEGEAWIALYESGAKPPPSGDASKTSVPADTAAKLRALGYTD
ncbi:MAG: sulfatase [Candidatus Binatia bacterium]|nr:sulfatase [Candidatus Binatia bacterium]